MHVRPVAGRVAGSRPQRGGHAWRGMLRGLPASLLLLLLLLLSVPAAWGVTSAPDGSLKRVAALISGGAPQLAIRMIDRQQPSPRHVSQWMVWERERYAAYAAERNWNAITRRATHLPAGIPDDFLQWVMVQAAEAGLSAHDGADARFFLRRLLWRERGTPAALARWRRMVIRSYLVDGDLADAATAVARYQKEYHANSDSWNTLRGTILLREGHNRTALSVLAGVRTYEGRLLLLLAGLRSGDYEPATVLTRALYLARVTRDRPNLNRQAWVLAANAAALSGSIPQHLSALEHALDFPSDADADDPLFRVDADDLWSAYEQAGSHIGNRLRLLVGDDRAWFARAVTYGRDYPPYERALYGFLSIHAATAKTRALAQEQLADSLFAEHDGRVVQALFSRSSRFPSLALVPPGVRYRLVNQAIADGNIIFAGRLMRSIKAPPPGDKADDWALRRARVLVYAGDFRDSLALLSGLLDRNQPPSDGFVRHYLQVIFELQAAGANRAAGDLLKSLFPLVRNPEIRRQILFWRADSDKTRGKFTRAAELYLRSAFFSGASADDMWGQTARYNAADALAKAGLTSDARSVYQRLLGSTRNPQRRVAIERRMQQLWLLKSRASTQ